MPGETSQNPAMAWAGVGQQVIGIWAAHQDAALQQRLNDANAQQSATVNAANNIRNAAQSSYSAYSKSVDNNKKLVYAGKAVEANVLNSLREEDALQKQGFEALIQDAEQRGAAAASAGFAGAAGSVVDQVNSTTALRTLRAQQEASVYKGQRAYDTSQRSFAIMQQVIGGLDSSTILPSFTYGRQVAQQAQRITNPWAFALAAAANQFARQQPAVTNTDSTQRAPAASFGPTDPMQVNLDYTLR